MFDEFCFGHILDRKIYNQDVVTVDSRTLVVHVGWLSRSSVDWRASCLQERYRGPDISMYEVHYDLRDMLEISSAQSSNTP